jgi:hypothetical protein
MKEKMQAVGTFLPHCHVFFPVFEFSSDQILKIQKQRKKEDELANYH